MPVQDAIPFPSTPSMAPLGLRLRAAWSRMVLTAIGIRATPRSGGRLAIVTSPAALSADPAIVEQVVRTARQRLSDPGAISVGRDRQDRADRRRVSELRAALPSLGQQMAVASARVTSLESQIPKGALPESPGILLHILLAGGLFAEGWLTYGALGFLAENPFVLLISSCVAAPIAAALLAHAGVLIRRNVWQGRVVASDAAMIVLGIALPTVFGIGITLSRVVDVEAGRTAALWMSAGVQAVLLALPLVGAYRYADPLPHLNSARKSRDRALKAHDQAAAELDRVVLESRLRAVAHDECLSRAKATFEHVLAIELAAAGRILLQRTRSNSQPTMPMIALPVQRWEGSK